MKKLVSIFLSLIMTFSCVEICFAQTEKEDAFIKLPDTYKEIYKEEMEYGTVLVYKSTQNKYERVIIMTSETELSSQNVNQSMVEYFEALNNVETVQGLYSFDKEFKIVSYKNIATNGFLSSNENGVEFAKFILMGDFQLNNGETKKLTCSTYHTIYEGNFYTIYQVVDELEDALSFANDVLNKIGYTKVTEEIVAADSSSSDKVKILLNGEYVYPDSEPVIVDGRTLVPIRVIAEKLGYKVEWLPNLNSVFIFDGDMRYNEETGGYTFVNSTIALAVVIGQNEIFKQAIAGTKTIEIDVAPMIMNDRTYLPLRAIGEALNCKVDWDRSNRTVIINSVN